MPGPLANLVLERANAPGTAATFNLGGAPSGWVGIVASVGNGGTLYYCISDGVQGEWGHGTVTAGALNGFTRGVIGNTQGTVQRLNFTGAVDVWCMLPAERTPFFDSANATLPMGGRRLAGLATGTAADDAPRLDQVGWRFIQQTVFNASTGGISFSLPAVFGRFRLEFQDVGVSVANPIYFRHSFDGGATYASGASDYSYNALEIRPTGLTPSGGVTSYAPVSPGAGSAVFGSMEFQVFGVKQCLFDSFTAVPGPVLSRMTGGASCNAAGTATNIFVGVVNASLTAGRFRLLGAAQ